MSLEVILGCMYSGKSTELIRRIRKHQAIKTKVLVVNHLNDNRYSTCNTTDTHSGDSVKAIKLTNIEDVSKYLDDCSVIAIDEAQFFKGLYDMVVHLVEELGKHVIVAGLSGDYKRKLFGEVYLLIPMADKLMLSVAYCSICKDGTSATFTRKIKGGTGQDVIDVGSTDKYITVCRQHYNMTTLNNFNN